MICVPLSRVTMWPLASTLLILPWISPAQASGDTIMTTATMTTATAAQPSREEVLRKILPSAVQVVVEQREGRRIKSGSGVAIASRRTGEGASCFVLTSGHTFSGIAGKAEIYAVFDRHLGPGQKV